MNITRENTGELTATIKIEILKQDYEEKVIKQLKDFQHKANLPGFRPGKVPVGLVRKMYGKAIVADEVNKIISDSLAQYIQDEKLGVLGNPLPNIEKNHDYLFETEQDFEFFFDLGLAPEIKLNLTTLPPVSRYVIKVDDKMLDNSIEDIRKRFGTPIITEPSKDENKLAETNNETELNNDVVASDEKQKPENDKTEIEPAALGVELYEKAYPGKEITTEEQFREQIKQDLSASFVGETEKLFYHNVTEALLHESPIQLPDLFLKRWLAEHKENNLTPEKVEEQYGSFSESMKWQLIENKLFQEFNLKVEDAEIRNYIKNYFFRMIPMNMEDEEAEKRFDSLVDTVMKNTEQVQKINDDLYTGKLIDLFKSNIPSEEIEISYEEFVTLASAKQNHEYDHNHLHEHDHEHNHEHTHDDNHEH